jgi:uncharacterized protein (DUF1919 family)
MSKNIILSNTCVGQSVIELFGIVPYNNPFIATLIPNDNDYLKLINNLSYYIKLEPTLGYPQEKSLFATQNNGLYYKHPSISVPYPIIYIDDIEIHCIHESNNIECLDKFKRRYDRMKEIIKSNDYKIISLLSFGEILNEHDNFNIFLDNYFLTKTDIQVERYFLGPSRLNVYNNNNYLVAKEWDNVTAERDESNIYKFNHQGFNTKMFKNNIKLI